jgi:hypothetical protein
VGSSRLAAILVFLLLLPVPAFAAGITFEAVDRTDSAPGEDLWEYAYRALGFDFSRDQGFSIFFDTALYATLGEPVPVGPDWDLLALQPDPLLAADGLYDALALVDHATVDVSFRIAFTWLGGPTESPGSQPFDIYELDANGSFLRTIATGTTVPVPEPGTAALLALGVLGSAFWQRQRLVSNLAARRLRRRQPPSLAFGSLRGRFASLR